jgi:hypothetical protein
MLELGSGRHARCYIWTKASHKWVMPIFDKIAPCFMSPSRQLTPLAGRPGRNAETYVTQEHLLQARMIGISLNRKALSRAGKT